MAQQNPSRIGNLLGAARAEADSAMLAQAFLSTNDFRALQTTNHYSFVVGRRGTGKTAYFLQLIKEYERAAKTFCHPVKPEEHDALGMLAAFNRLGLNSYAAIRPTARVLWHTAMLITVANDLTHHWKFGATADAQWLRDYIKDRRGLTPHNELRRCTMILKEVSAQNCSAEEIPGMIAAEHQLSLLEARIRHGLEDIGAKAVFLFDGLDEGWTPDPKSTAVLGGLATAAAGFIDKNISIQGKLFIRDNIFRSLAALDRDFSRHIEGDTLRLHWTQDSLLNLVASRLRVALDVPTLENSTRVWNRFAHREIRGRDGFLRCLQHTLYRPRDLLVLLNQAATWAAREGRQAIVESDVEEISKQISLNRLEDLLKEYEGVFPGLRAIAGYFSGTQSFQSTKSVRTQLDSIISEENYASVETSDVAILSTGSQIIDALYSVGFLGLEDPATGRIRFCHDGATSSISESTETQRILIHPCYWKALDVADSDTTTELIVDLYDDYKAHVNSDVADQRVRMLGQLVSDLPNYPSGREGAKDYENWVLRTCQILFAGTLANFQLHPAPDAIQRRDVLATNQAERGFWKRVLTDYNCRQVVFEAKNYASLQIDDFRQALSYSGQHYGKLIFLVHRQDSESMETTVRGWIKEIWSQHRVIVMPLPTALLSRCLRKIRTPKRRDYTEQAMQRRLDTFERDYLSLRHTPKARRERKR